MERGFERLDEIIGVFDPDGQSDEVVLDVAVLVGDGRVGHTAGEAR